MMSLFSIAYAAVDPTPAFARVIDPILDHIVYPLIALMFAVAIIVFVWGIVEMVMHSGEAEGRDKGRNHMIGGVVGIFIMISAWGIVYLVSDTLMEFR